MGAQWGLLPFKHNRQHASAAPIRKYKPDHTSERGSNAPSSHFSYLHLRRLNIKVPLRTGRLTERHSTSPVEVLSVKCAQGNVSNHVNAAYLWVQWDQHFILRSHVFEPVAEWELCVLYFTLLIMYSVWLFRFHVERIKIQRMFFFSLWI